MIVKNVTKEQMWNALIKLNERYDNNIEFYTTCLDDDGLTPVGRRFKFRLTAKSYDKPGWRRSYSGRRMKFACWHVHGEFFDILLDMVPEAEIRSLDLKIHNLPMAMGRMNNWQDRNIGSQMQPMMFSEACNSVEGHPYD